MTVGCRLSWHDVVAPVITLAGNFSELDNTDLTQLLQVIADNGVDAFYTGDVARDIVQQVSGLDVVCDGCLEFLFVVFNCFKQRSRLFALAVVPCISLSGFLLPNQINHYCLLLITNNPPTDCIAGFVGLNSKGGEAKEVEKGLRSRAEG